MSAADAQAEPTMEEILAAIRRIISEEDRPSDSGGEVLDLQPPTPPPVEAKAPPRHEPEPAIAAAPAEVPTITPMVPSHTQPRTKSSPCSRQRCADPGVRAQHAVHRRAVRSGRLHPSPTSTR